VPIATCTARLVIGMLAGVVLDEIADGSGSRWGLM
jgi:hypothetical protein